MKNAARFFAFPPRRFGLGLTLDRAFLVFTLGLVGELGADGLVKAGHLVLGDSDVLFDFAFLLTGRTETAAGTHQGLDFGVAALEGKTTEAETFQRNVAALFEELFPEEERKKKNLSMNVERSHTGRHKLTNHENMSLHTLSSSLEVGLQKGPPLVRLGSVSPSSRGYVT